MHRRQESRLAIRSSKHTGENKKPVCGDSRHDLNYPEFSDSWNNKEKTTMANFKDKINSHEEFFLFDQDSKYFIERVGSMKMFERKYDFLSTNAYRLFIQYKNTHRAKKMAGRCFLWDNSHEDNMAYPCNVIELRSLNDASQDDCEVFCKLRFDGMEAAIFITDHCVFMYGDTWFEAVDLEEKHVVCNAYVCGRFVSEFRIPAEVFDRHFGLKENFPEQYEKVFGKAEDAKPVQKENDLIEEAKRNIESCMNLLDTNECQLERAMDAIKLALIDIEDRKRELGDMLRKFK